MQSMYSDESMLGLYAATLSSAPLLLRGQGASRGRYIPPLFRNEEKVKDASGDPAPTPSSVQPAGERGYGWMDNRTSIACMQIAPFFFFPQTVSNQID